MERFRGSVLEGPRVEGAEKEPRLDFPHAGIQARLLVGHDLINPRKKAREITTNSVSPEGIQTTVTNIGKLSNKERSDFYNKADYENMNYAARMADWNKNFSEFLNGKEAQIGNKQEWEKLCKQLGLKDADGKLNVQDFYSRYFGEGDEKANHDTNATRFAQDGLGLYRENGELRYRGTPAELDQKREWLEQIGKWSLGDVSGTLMSLLTEARAAYGDERTRDAFVSQANRIASENNLLKPLWEVADKSVASPATRKPVQTRPAKPMVAAPAVKVSEPKLEPVVQGPALPTEEELEDQRKKVEAAERQKRKDERVAKRKEQKERAKQAVKNRGGRALQHVGTIYKEESQAMKADTQRAKEIAQGLKEKVGKVSKKKVLAVATAVTLLGGAVYLGSKFNTVGDSERDPQPATEQLLQGPLHTKGKWILDKHGKKVQLASVQWTGMDEGVPFGIWDQGQSIDVIMKSIKDAGLNTLRVPIAYDTFATPGQPQFVKSSNLAKNHPELAKATPKQVMDYFLKVADKEGMKVVFDMHANKHGNWLDGKPFSTQNYDSPSGNQIYGLNDTRNVYKNTNNFADMVKIEEMLAKEYANNPAVIGMDVFNEPYKDGWVTGNRNTDWRWQAEQMGGAVQKQAKDWLIVVEGVGPDNSPELKGNVGSSWNGGNLNKAAEYPIRLGKLVYSPHEYGPSVYKQNWFSPFQPKMMETVWDNNWGYLAKNDIAPIWVGEMSAPKVGEVDASGKPNPSVDTLHAKMTLDYLYDIGGGYNIFPWHTAGSEDTEGMVDKGKTAPSPEKVEMIRRLKVDKEFGKGTGERNTGFAPQYENFDPSKHPGLPPTPNLKPNPVQPEPK